MGMYTEFVVSMRLRGVPDDAAGILQWMATGDLLDPPKDLPSHPFFRCDRWRYLFRMSSYSFIPVSAAKFRYDEIGNYHVLVVRSDIKNYEGEIRKFIDWIRPWMGGNNMNAVVGYSRYEGDALPILLIGSGDWLRIVTLEAAE